MDKMISKDKAKFQVLFRNIYMK